MIFSMSESLSIDSVMARKTSLKPLLSERETVRFTLSQKSLLKRAADLAEQGVTDIIREGALLHASGIIARSQEAEASDAANSGDRDARDGPAKGKAQ